jgi:hypothetical protein
MRATLVILTVLTVTTAARAEPILVATFTDSRPDARIVDRPTQTIRFGIEHLNLPIYRYDTPVFTLDDLGQPFTADKNDLGRSLWARVSGNLSNSDPIEGFNALAGGGGYSVLKSCLIGAGGCPGPYADPNWVIVEPNPGFVSSDGIGLVGYHIDHFEWTVFADRFTLRVFVAPGQVPEPSAISLMLLGLLGLLVRRHHTPAFRRQ